MAFLADRDGRRGVLGLVLSSGFRFPPRHLGRIYHTSVGPPHSGDFCLERHSSYPECREFTIDIVRHIHNLALPFAGSMSSIKRDVKEKVLPRPESRCFLEIWWKQFQQITARFPLLRPKLYLPYGALQSLATL